MHMSYRIFRLHFVQDQLHVFAVHQLRVVCVIDQLSCRVQHSLAIVLGALADVIESLSYTRLVVRSAAVRSEGRDEFSET